MKMASQDTAGSSLKEKGEECRFLAITDVDLKKESLAEFTKWFSDINDNVLSRFDGFVSRILVESSDGKHKIILMTRDKESLLRIRASPQHKELHSKALTFMSRPPVVSFYSVAAR
jgi:hypothetical protein